MTDLHRVMSGPLARILRGSSIQDDLADLLQESTARVLSNLASFRGDSAFTTWATAIAIRVGYTELRRSKVRDGQLPRFSDPSDPVPDPRTPLPDESVSKGDVLSTLERAITDELTDRQRRAIRAELRGVPTIEIAEQLNISQNTLYKLVHDARRALRAALTRSGFDASSIRDRAWEAPR